ncbi:glycine cleavage system transcriptional repressor [Microlunatus ginsengisoli]|uniref:glycine cleavage system protein R n=1 Tax=Microlunatus ginsengisoli TaxID=363863 RepID=UPI0031D04C52
MATLVLTVVGDDRVGLIKALADIVSAHGGNWERSHLAELDGTFAGVVVVTVPDQRTAALQAALAPLEGLLEVSVRPTAAPAPGTARRVRLDLIGNDRPGIVAAVSDVLVRHRLSVADLQTSTREAPMAGGMLFEATAVVTVTDEDSLDAVRADLEVLASEILVDLSLTAVD